MNFTAADLIQLSIFIISLSVFFKKPAESYLKLFPVYFFCLMVVDKLIEYTTSRGIHNNILPNSWGIAEFSFYLFVLRRMIVNVFVKRIILNVIFIYLFFAIVNILIIQKNDLFNPVNFTIGSVITIVFCIYYFVELFQGPATQSLMRQPSFWFISAILFNVVLIFPIFALISFINPLNKANNNTSKIILDHIVAIFNIISILTYILYSIGFLCRIRFRRSAL